MSLSYLYSKLLKFFTVVPCYSLKNRLQELESQTDRQTEYETIHSSFTLCSPYMHNYNKVYLII